VSQWPRSGGQSAIPLHTLPVSLQALSGGQALSARHCVAVSIEHVPGAQSVAVVHAVRLMLQSCIGGQSPSLWHWLPLELHVPGPQTGPRLHGPHSLVHRLQPGGIQSMGHVDGSGKLQTCVVASQLWMFWQVCGYTFGWQIGFVAPLQCCGTVGQVCEPSGHV